MNPKQGGTIAIAARQGGDGYRDMRERGKTCSWKWQGITPRARVSRVALAAAL